MIKADWSIFYVSMFIDGSYHTIYHGDGTPLTSYILFWFFLNIDMNGKIQKCVYFLIPVVNFVLVDLCF